jgi:hypothetical protein
MAAGDLPMIAPNPADAPREFLTQLYRAAVQRALPLHSMAPFLPQKAHKKEAADAAASDRDQ